MTKKNVFLLAIGGTIIFFLSAFQKEIGFCGHIYNNCWDIIDLIWPPFMIFLPFAFLSLLTYRMRDEIFRAWTAFAVWWVPLSMFVTFIAPEEIRGSISVPVKWPIAVLCAGVFLLVSLVIILWKHYSLKK